MQGGTVAVLLIYGELKDFPGECILLFGDCFCKFFLKDRHEDNRQESSNLDVIPAACYDEKKA